MAGNELDVKTIEEIKRLDKLGLSRRKIARTLNIHRNTVNKYLDGDAVNAPTVVVEPEWVCNVDWEKVRSECLGGVTLSVIYEELWESGKVPVQYPGFWKQVKSRIPLSEATMVRIFKPGERIEIDYADGIDILDPVSGELRKTQLFVGVLCHSRYAFAEFTWSQSSSDFLQSHVNMFKFFGGSSEVLSPDNLKSAVTKAHRYDPTINPAYTRLAEHYNVAVVPALVRSPKHKAIVERTIQIFQRWFFMRIRYRTFTSLLELNQCLNEHLTLFHQKRHRIFKRSRAEMFQEERQYLRSLPVEPYLVATYTQAKLSRDCHLIFDDNFYSAPHWLRDKYIDVWATSLQVQIYHEAERVAIHMRGKSTWKFITDTNHYPPAQQAYAEEDVQKLLSQAAKVGPEATAMINSLLKESHPLRHLRRIKGIISLSWKYSAAALENACRDANRFKNYNLQYIERVIKAQKEIARTTELAITKRAYNPHLRGTNNIH
jgi:transposase